MAEIRRPKSGARVLGQFYIIDNLADPIILGLPEMSQLGAYVEPADEQGRYWVQFTSPTGGGLRLPMLQPRGKDKSRVKLFQAVEVVGPALLQVSSVMTREEYEWHVE